MPASTFSMPTSTQSSPKEYQNFIYHEISEIQQGEDSDEVDPSFSKSSCLLFF